MPGDEPHRCRRDRSACDGQLRRYGGVHIHFCNTTRLHNMYGRGVWSRRADGITPQAARAPSISKQPIRGIEDCYGETAQTVNRQSPATDMEETTMNPVVHFEMPYEDRKRMAKFYESA